MCSHRQTQIVQFDVVSQSAAFSPLCSICTPHASHRLTTSTPPARLPPSFLTRRTNQKIFLVRSRAIAQRNPIFPLLHHRYMSFSRRQFNITSKHALPCKRHTSSQTLSAAVFLLWLSVVRKRAPPLPAKLPYSSFTVATQIPFTVTSFYSSTKGSSSAAFSALSSAGSSVFTFSSSKKSSSNSSSRSSSKSSR